MAESQNIEYKESWRDEYLKWVCGFANAQGGTIYIGIDDAGNVVGVKDVKKLMEDIPNKIQSGLGIVADVNKHTKDGKDYLATAKAVKEKLALDFIKTLPCGSAEYCWLSYEPENEDARKLYSSFGFTETGDMDGEEMIAVLRL